MISRRFFIATVAAGAAVGRLVVKRVHTGLDLAGGPDMSVPIITTYSNGPKVRAATYREYQDALNKAYSQAAFARAETFKVPVFYR